MSLHPFLQWPSWVSSVIPPTHGAHNWSAVTYSNTTLESNVAESETHFWAWARCIVSVMVHCLLQKLPQMQLIEVDSDRHTTQVSLSVAATSHRTWTTVVLVLCVTTSWLHVLALYTSHMVCLHQSMLPIVYKVGDSRVSLVWSVVLCITLALPLKKPMPSLLD